MRRGQPDWCPTFVIKYQSACHVIFGLFLALLALTFLPFAPARGQLTIEIVGGAGTTIPIAIVPFEGESTYPLGISGVVGADLARSGMFKLVNTEGVTPRPARAEEVQAGVWRSRSADAVVVGSMRPLGDGRVEVRVALVDVVKQAVLANMTYSGHAAAVSRHRAQDRRRHLRKAHRRSGRVLDAHRLHHQGGDALPVAGGRCRRQRSADHRHVQRAVAVAALVARRLRASPTSRSRQKKPVVYVQNLATGGRQAVANFRGSNSAPAWSPDGRRLAVTLTKDGGSQLYVMNADGTNAQRVMSSNAIDTEAHFMPDGQSLIFTSDRGGSPQIYRLKLGAGTIERLTFDGTYNVSPRPLPDGKGFVFVRREGDRYQIALQDFATRQVQVLTSGPVDESPSIAPNGKLIIYASDVGGRGILAAVSSDGRVKQRLGLPRR